MRWRNPGAVPWICFKTQPSGSSKTENIQLVLLTGTSSQSKGAVQSCGRAFLWSLCFSNRLSNGRIQKAKEHGRLGVTTDRWQPGGSEVEPEDGGSTFPSCLPLPLLENCCHGLEIKLRSGTLKSLPVWGFGGGLMSWWKAFWAGAVNS